MRIGLFDSGLGGLWTARKLRLLRPDVSLVYFGDTAHLPYGDKSPAQIEEYSREIVRYLRRRGVEGIAIACNTASAVALEAVRKAAAPLPVWDVVQPAAAALTQHRYPEPIGIIGTYRTIRSGIYREALERVGYTVRELATPVLVPLIEEGWIEHPATEAALDAYLGELGEVSTLLLACTHYPLLEGAIRRYYARQGRNVVLLSTAGLLAEQLGRELTPSPARRSTEEFWVSAYSTRFQRLADQFWGQPVPIALATWPLLPTPPPRL